ncbi:MAG: M15 family metallopeptidase [Candidatus Saccharimonadales bacterium]
MRVIHPKKQPEVKPKRRPPKASLLVLLLTVVGISAFLVLRAHTSEAPAQDNVTSTVTQNISEIPKKGTLKTFTGQQFKELYNSFAYPNTQYIGENTPITGNDAADGRIRQVAVARGYQLRSAPVTSAFQDVGQGYLLQQRAAQPWLDLVAEAKKDGITIRLTAAYRSAEDQKQLFITHLQRLAIPAEAIPSGAYDGQISQALRTTAIPGYSRHHTGYTIDISCENMPTSSFQFTSCFKWLSADNYKKAKTHGWIPSYPDGAGEQGPDPESWEYVWVGVDAVTE